MHSTEEQLREIMKRAEFVKEKRVIAKHLRASAAASFACIALLITVSVYLPKLKTVLEEQTVQQYGSLLLAAPYMGYAVIAVLAFVLGICITLFCIHWKELKQKEHTKK